MTSIFLKADAQIGKYGVVIVYNKDRTISRQYKITGEELRNLQQSTNDPPPGVSREDWEAGMAEVLGKDFEVGDMRRNDDGSIRIKFAEENFLESFLELTPEDYLESGTEITIKPEVLSSIRYISTDKRIEDLQDGVLIWQ